MLQEETLEYVGVEGFWAAPPDCCLRSFCLYIYIYIHMTDVCVRRCLKGWADGQQLHPFLVTASCEAMAMYNPLNVLSGRRPKL